MKKFRDKISLVLAVLFTAFISLGRLLGGVCLATIAGAFNILRNIAGVIVGSFYEVASWIKATVRYSIGFIAELAFQAWNLLGAVIGLLAEGLNIARHAIGYFLSFITAPYDWAKDFIGKAVGIGIALLNALRHLVGAVVGLLAQIPYLFWHGAIATINCFWYFSVRASAIIAEFFMLLRPIGSFLLGVLVAFYHGAGKPLRVVVSVFSELANMIKHGLGVMAGLVAEVFSHVWQAIGTGLGLMAELTTACYYLARPLLRIAAAFGLEFLFSGLYALRAAVGALFELVHWVRRAVAQVLGAVYGLLRGLLYEKYSMGWTNGRDFFLKENFLFGNELTLKNIGDTYSFIRGKEYEIGSAGMKLWSDTAFMSGNYKALDKYKSIAQNSVFMGKYEFGAAYKKVARGKHYFGGNYYFGLAYKTRLETMEENKKTARESFNSCFNSFLGDYKFGAIWNKANAIKGIDHYYEPWDFYTKVARNKFFGQKYESTTWGYDVPLGKQLIGEPVGFWENHKKWTQYSALFGGNYQWGAAYKHVAQSNFFGGKWKFAENKVFNSTDNKFGIRYQWGFNFSQFNRSKLFGKKSWLQQTVARDAFKAIAGYEFGQTLRKASLERAKKDYILVKNNCNKVLTTASGFVAGAVTMIPFGVIYYALVGCYGGGKRSEWGALVGVISGFFHGLVKGFTYPFRNAYRNLQIYIKKYKFNPKESLFKQDSLKLLYGENIDWQKEPKVLNPPEQPMASGDLEAKPGSVGSVGHDCKTIEVGSAITNACK